MPSTPLNDSILDQAQMVWKFDYNICFREGSLYDCFRHCQGSTSFIKKKLLVPLMCEKEQLSFKILIFLCELFFFISIQDKVDCIT